jgi:leader peptidase (prepilin peptidase) / N-methyltransferase
VLPIILSALAGWLAGGAANLAADVLPGLGQGARPAVGGATVLAHYLTLPWYLLRGGVCPHCQLRRPWRAPALEAATVTVFVVTGIRFAASPAAVLVLWLYAVFLLAVVVIDLEHRRVLNVMLLPAAAVAIVLSLAPAGPGLPAALLGGGVGLAAFALLALAGRGALGMGDVKLAAVIGLMAGYPRVLSALGLGILLGGLGALLLLLIRRVGRKSFIAYAPYLSVGALAVLLMTWAA